MPKLDNLVSSEIRNNSKKLQVYFCPHWLPKYEMWVSAYRTNLLEVVVNTTNGVEGMNKEFKKCFRDNHDKSLSRKATVLVKTFCPYIHNKYVIENIKPLEKRVKYDESKLPRGVSTDQETFSITYMVIIRRFMSPPCLGQIFQLCLAGIIKSRSMSMGIANISYSRL